MQCLLGIDIGTTSTKVVLIDGDSRLLGVSSASHPIETPRPGWTQQDPAWWWASTVEAITRLFAQTNVSPHAVGAVGLSGQMHGSVFLTREAVESGGVQAPVAHPALLWNDQRTASYLPRIAEIAGGRDAFLRRTGNAPVTGFTLPKILWLREHEPEAFARTQAIALPKDYVRLRLTGELATDVGDASGTLLFSPATRAWDVELAGRFGISSAMLPRVLESCAVAGRISAWAATQTGLRVGTPVVAGSGDNQCGAAGAGVVEPGLALVALGTSGVICVHSAQPRIDEATSRSPGGRLHCVAACDGDGTRAGGWCVTGVMLAAAGALQWVRDTLCADESFEALVSEAATAPAGCDGLIFLPHISGERCPHADPGARGAWIGLSAAHTRAHLLRSVIEGVTITMVQILDLVRATGAEVRELRIGGGGAKSALWRGMLADLARLPVVLPTTEEGPAFGAALMAGVGAGVWPSLAAACRAGVAISERREPDLNPALNEANGLKRAVEAHAHAFAAIRPIVRGLGAVRAGE